jgi:hypothetical protein
MMALHGVRGPGGKRGTSWLLYGVLLMIACGDGSFMMMVRALKAVLR